MKLCLITLSLRDKAGAKADKNDEEQTADSKVYVLHKPGFPVRGKLYLTLTLCRHRQGNEGLGAEKNIEYLSQNTFFLRSGSMLRSSAATILKTMILLTMILLGLLGQRLI